MELYDYLLGLKSKLSFREESDVNPSASATAQVCQANIFKHEKQIT